MSAKVRCLLGGLIFLSSGLAARAQIVPVSGSVKLVRKLVRGEFTDYTVVTTTYRGQPLVTQRAITDKLRGPATDQILFLEAQLATCYTTLFADSTARICSAAQQATLRATQALVAKARPLWNQQHYREEVAFYLAEDARRQRAAAPTAPAK